MMSRKQLLAFCCFILCNIAALAETRRALVIGNNAYPGNSLENAKNDAIGVYDALKSAGYVSTLVLDADKATLTRQVDDFVDTLHDGDSAVLYYAGHGMQVDGENFLIPVDFKVTTEASGKEQAYSLSAVLERFTSHGAKTQVVILDACRDNPFQGTRSVKGGWAGLGTSAGAFLAFGTSPGSTASDAPGLGHGLFTKSLLSYLTTSDQDIEEMFRKVRESVIRDSGGKQVPWISSSLIGSFHIRPELDAQLPGLAPVTGTPDDGVRRGRSLDAGSATDEFIATSGPDGDSDGDEAALRQAVAAVRGENIDGAIAILEKLVSVQPHAGTAFRLLGLLLHTTGRDTEALASLDRAISANEDDSRAAIYKCAIETEGGVGPAATDCATLVRNQPSSDAYLVLAARSLNENQFAHGYEEASEAIAMGGSDLAYAVRGALDKKKGEPRLATRDFSKAVEMSVEHSAH